MKVIESSNKLLSIKDVSERLNISEATVKRYIYSGKIHSIKMGNARRIAAGDLAIFMRKTESQKSFIVDNDLKIIPGYMGIKTQILDRIDTEIQKLAKVKKGNVILDVFAGSGTVAYALKRHFTVYANDIEPYSYIVNKLLIDNTVTKAEIEDFDVSSFEKNYEENLRELRGQSPGNMEKYRQNHSMFPYALFTGYFSGTYFGKEQAAQIDSLRYAIDHANPKFKNLLLSCLIFSCYQTVTSVGSHFAQPKIAKEKNQRDIEKKRSQDVKKHFERKFGDVREKIYVDSKKNKVFCSDFHHLLDPKRTAGIEKISVTYIDPPYTIDHYSRFYHILNTLVLYDYPERTGKGLYRGDRYQSKFCIKSTAKKEFESLVSKVAALGSSIVMSYSDGYRSLMTINDIMETLRKYYKPASVKEPIKIEYSYSGFGRSASHKANELLFIAIDRK